MREDLGQQLNVPPLDDYGQLLFMALTEAGPLQSSFGGYQALSWGEISAYILSTGMVWDGDDALELHAMSKAFEEGRRTGENVFGIEPATVEDSEEE